MIQSSLNLYPESDIHVSSMYSYVLANVLSESCEKPRRRNASSQEMVGQLLAQQVELADVPWIILLFIWADIT